MELTKLETVIPSFKKIYETTGEQGIDTDFSLPDYYPEVSKVLKCCADVNILSAQCSDAGVSIGGQVVLTLLYADNDKKINSFTHIVPFAKSIEAQNLNGCNAVVNPRVGYLNTKAVAPRKLEVHGSLALTITVNGIENTSVISELSGDGLYAKCTEKLLTMPLNTVSKAIFSEDEIQIPQTKPAVSKILRSCAKATVTECKLITGKIVVKGDADIEILYCPVSDEKPILLKEQRGFSQIFDCDSDTEDIVCDAFARVDSLELHPKTGLDGEVRNIAVEMKIGIEVTPYTEVKNCLVTDAFSGKYTADITTENIKTEDITKRIFENYVQKKTLDFGSMLAEVSDLWCKPTVDFTAFEGEDIIIKGTVLVNILGESADKEPLLFERTMEYEYRDSVGYSENGFRCRPTVDVVATEFSLNSDGSLDLAVELKISAAVFKVNVLNAVVKASVDETGTLPRDNETAVVLYFPENESVWEVARKYRTSPQKICEVNNLDSVDTVCDCQVLIPNI